MRTILVAASLVASVGFADAQPQQGDSRPPYAFAVQGATTLLLRADRMEQRGDLLYGRNVTFTIGNVVVSADEFTMAKSGEVQLGSNARMAIPVTGK
jgi:hypothetical protein